MTPEYAQFYSEVCFRSGGICEVDECREVASQVHHVVRISRNPRLAVDAKNGKHLCKQHHRSIDPSHRRWLSGP